MKFKQTLIGSTLLVVAFGSSALSLGRARGAVVLGQPLDLSIDVRLDQADDAVGQCFEAEVFHADSRVEGNRVQVTVQNITSSLGAVVRIRSSAIVDEPVLSVTLRATCGQTASRKYDFLTDFPVETRANAVPTVIPAAITAPAAAASDQAGRSPTSVTTGTAAGTTAGSFPSPTRNAGDANFPAPAQPRPVTAPRPPRPIAAQRPATPKPTPIPPKAAAPTTVPAAPGAPAVQAAPVAPIAQSAALPNRPRLRLDPPTANEDRQVPLKSSSELLSAPTDNAQQRAEATAAWRSLNQLPPENTVQDEKDKARLQALENESKSLRAKLAKSEEDFRLRLERLESSRYDGNVVYLLLALLLAALAAAALFWNRARKSDALAADWSRHNDPLAAEADAAALAAGPAMVSARMPLAPEAKASRGPGRPASPAMAEPDIDESLFQDLKKLKTVTLSPSLSTEALRAPASAAATLAPAPAARGLAPEDFFDVQQHADFFVSLGQYEQAIDVLKKNIDENIEVSPLAYLELLKIYHTLSRQDDYNALRANFNRIFNGNVPPFASFSDEGHGLEDYPAALMAIESHWGTPQVLDIIESNLYRDPAAPSAPAYDLAAYREFLLLYAIAKTMVRRTGPGAPVDLPGNRISRPAPIAPMSAPLGAASAVPAFVSGQAPVAAATPAPVSRPEPPMFDLSSAAMVLDEPLHPEPVVGDGFPTQPMLLMPDTGLAEPSYQLASNPPPAYRQPLDLDLD
ncbi:MAG: hypothetical protein JWQ88_3600, partial [Rhodoferax sp.]|nr:hypothetical protein [Rhodoferax sp.]